MLDIFLLTHQVKNVATVLKTTDFCKNWWHYILQIFSLNDTGITFANLRTPFAQQRGDLSSLVTPRLVPFSTIKNCLPPSAYYLP